MIGLPAAQDLAVEHSKFMPTDDISNDNKDNTVASAADDSVKTNQVTPVQNAAKDSRGRKDAPIDSEGNDRAAS